VREVVVEPIFNRTLIMEIGDTNFHAVRPVLHGFPLKDDVRHLLPHRRRSRLPGPQLHLRPQLLSEGRNPLAKRLAKDLLPPIVQRALKPKKT
jgi:hypothetical protein